MPSDQVLPTDSSKYTWEADARAAVDGTYTKDMTVSGSKNGKVGTWTFSGWDTGTLDADTGVITFHATWTFEAAAPSIIVPSIVCKVGKAIKPVAMETVNPVSYTHLDVYKRQIHMLTILIFRFYS